MEGEHHPNKKHDMAQPAVGEDTKLKESKSNNKQKKTKNDNDNAMTNIPAVCLSCIIGFLDFDSLLLLRVTSSNMKQTVDKEMMCRAIAWFPRKRHERTYVCCDSSVQLVDMSFLVTLTQGWSEQWTTRHAVVSKASGLAHSVYGKLFPGRICEETARIQRYLQYTNRIIFSEEGIYGKVAIEKANRSMSPRKVWERVVDMLHVFELRHLGLDTEETNDMIHVFDLRRLGLDTEETNVRLENGCDSYRNLRPMMNAIFGVLVQAKKSSVAFSQVSYEYAVLNEPTTGGWQDGQISAVMFETQDGQQFQLNIRSDS
jgi:hypothetical protein